MLILGVSLYNRKWLSLATNGSHLQSYNPKIKKEKDQVAEVTR